jgi:pimeloyl-ACP methyl ester carboxylesterase
MAAPQTHWTKSGDVSIAYQVVGDGPVDLAFVPGFIGHVEGIWEKPEVARFFDRLASFSRLILFDKRGMGLSDRPTEPPTLEQSMDDLRAVLDAAGSRRPALFGVSEGGPMSLLFAATYPERVRSLVLFGTYARIVPDEDYPIGIPRETVEQFFDLVERNWGGPVGLSLWAPSVAADPAARAWWSRFLRMAASPRTATNLLRLYVDIDVREVLPSISVPTLVLHRSGDRVVPVALGRYIAERIPGARFVELPGDDHVPAFGDADALLGEVEELLTGQRGARESDRVLATVLFTDIVDSTRRAAELGDGPWRVLLEDHNRLVRREIERHRGREVKSTGDGFLATFDGPARGVRCAQAIAREVRRLGIEVRAGLHTGECEIVDHDVAGMAVHIGARVGARAGPGEVLVSNTVKDLVVGSGLDFAERGECELKGVPGSWRLYAVTS